MSNPTSTFLFPEVRVVEASAGSGKTYALAKRYVQLILDQRMEAGSASIRSILAITFTNKSASEMKARILYFLKAIALGQLPKMECEEILGPIGLDQTSARPKAFLVMEELIRNYNFFQVQTIDKFIRTLLLSCALKVKLTANFRIKTNAADYLEYSLDELIDRGLTSENIRKLFDQFLHNYLYLENRTGWFPKDDMMAILMQLYMETNTYGKAFYRSPIEPGDLMKQKRIILEEMRALKEILPEGTNKIFSNGIDSLLEDNAKGFDIDNLSDTFRHEELLVNKNVKASKAAEDLWRKIRGQLRQLCEDEAHSLFNPYLDIFTLVNENFRKNSSLDDVMFLEELNKKANVLFDQEQVTMQELYYRLATRFRHYLIDEFQDTSQLQWANLHGLAEDALSTGGSLFYVGDRKQAIYGFRGGDVALFDGVKDGFQHFNVQIDVLSKNWRSHKEVVDFNNSIFDPENIRRMIAKKHEHDAKDKNAVTYVEDDITQLAHHFQAAHQEFREDSCDGYVQIQSMDVDNKEARDEIIRAEVLKIMNELKERFSYGDIAFLARSNDQIALLTQWLLQENIPVESERTSDVREHAVIIDLMAFLRFLHSPIDNLSFTKFILSDVFIRAAGLPVQELHNFVFSLRSELKGEKNTYVYTHFRSKYPQIWDKFIQEYFQNIGLYPLYELTVSIFSKLQCFENYPDAHGFLMHFLEIMKTKEDDYGDLEGFLAYFENLRGDEPYVRSVHSDAVTILTVHKSKGLEFPVVIIPFLGMDVQVGTQASDNKQSYVLSNRGNEVALIRLKKKYRLFSQELKTEYDREYKKNFISELNNLYVSLTRAKRELYAFIPSKVGRSFNLAQLILPAEYTSGKKKKYETKKSTQHSFIKLEASGSTDWLNYLKDEFTAVDDVLKREERKQGEILHFALSHLKSIDGELDLLIKDAVLRTSFQFDLKDEVQVWEKRLKEFILSDDIRPLFFCSNAKVETEKDFVDENGITRRIDRLVVTDKEAWVIDFKTSQAQSEEHEAQVKEYTRLIHGIYPKHRVKGFLVYADEKKVKEI